MAGRKPKLTKNLIEKFTNYISNGVSKRIACRGCGVTESIFYGWIQEVEQCERGEISKEQVRYYELKKELNDKIKKEEAEFINRILGEIVIDKDWKAKAWTLERRFPQEFGRTDRIKDEEQDNGLLSELTQAIKEHKNNES